LPIGASFHQIQANAEPSARSPSCCHIFKATIDVSNVIDDGRAGGTRSYRYDLDGSRVYKSDPTRTDTYVFDRTDQLVTETNGTTNAVYDAFGNQAKKPEDDLSQTTLADDAANRLTTVSPATGSADPGAYARTARRRRRSRRNRHPGHDPAQAHGHDVRPDSAVCPVADHALGVDPVVDGEHDRAPRLRG